MQNLHINFSLFSIFHEAASMGKSILPVRPLIEGFVKNGK